MRVVAVHYRENYLSLLELYMEKCNKIKGSYNKLSSTLEAVCCLQTTL